MSKNKDFNQKRFRLVITLKELGYIFLSIFIIIFLIYVFYYELITINFAKDIKKGYYLTFYLNNESYVVGLLFTFMVGLMFLAYLQALGLNIMKSNIKTRLFLVCYILYLFTLGFISTGIGIEISENLHLGILNYEKFESNSLRGIKFYISNFYPLFIFLYAFSFPIDSRKKR